MFGYRAAYEDEYFSCEKKKKETNLEIDFKDNKTHLHH